MSTKSIDCIHELELAAETSRAEHAAALRRPRQPSRPNQHQENKMSLDVNGSALDVDYGIATATFDAWWARANPKGTVDEIVRAAWNAAIAQSTNYVADKSESPTSVTFANGRTVRIVPADVAALGLATARVRELEGEREERLGLVKRINALELENWPTRKNARYVDQRDELTAESCAIVARIEKATKP